MSRPPKGTAAPDLRTLAGDLAAALTRTRRVLRRAVRRGWPYEPLPRNQIELLRLAGERPGVSVAAAAAALALAPNTVSTLVNELRQMGLLERTPDSADRRMACLTPTAAGAARLAAWRDRRVELLEAALAELSQDDRAALAVSVAALEHLDGVLEREDQ